MAITATHFWYFSRALLLKVNNLFRQHLVFNPSKMPKPHFTRPAGLDACIHLLDSVLYPPSVSHMDRRAALQLLSHQLRTLHHHLTTLKEQADSTPFRIAYCGPTAEYPPSDKLYHPSLQVVLLEPNQEFGPTFNPDGILLICDQLGETQLAFCQRTYKELRISSSCCRILLVRQPIDPQMGKRALDRGWLTLSYHDPQLHFNLKHYLQLYRQLQHQIAQLLLGVSDQYVATDRSGFKAKLDRVLNALLTSDRLSVERLCLELNYSRSHLGRKVKQATGMSITHYINHLKLEHSKYLLCQSDWPVGRISSELNYSSQQYFCHLFRRAYGLTPKQFRSKHMTNIPNS